LIASARHDAAWGQSAADMQAARETELPGLRLVGVRDVDYHLGTLGIRIGYVEQDVRPGSGHYFCGALTLDRSATAAQPVAAALTRLSYLSVHKLGLRYVILCGGAKAGDRSIGGIPVPPLDLLMLDVGASSNGAYLERTTLHELYHMTEFRFGTFQDGDWEREFSGYSFAYSPDLLKTGLGSGKPGFLDAYAETFPSEDRAELFAALLLKPGDVLEQIRATRDSVLWRKVRYMDLKAERLLALRLAPDRL